MSSLERFANTFWRLAQHNYWGSKAAGLFIICKEDGTGLLLKRSAGVQNPGTWGIAGGALEHGEDNSLEGAKREALEELSALPPLNDFIDTVIFKDGDFTYTTYVYNISREAKKQWTQQIKLNWENDRWQWFSLDSLPANLHFGVEFIKKTLTEKGHTFFEEAKDGFDWLRQGLRALEQQATDKEPFQSLSMLLEQPPQIWGEGRIEPAEQRIYFENLKTSLHRLLKHYLRQKDFPAAYEVRSLLKKLFMSASHTIEDYKKRYEENPDIKQLPKREQAAHSGLLYHGTYLADALSVLKNNTFQKGSAFDRLSLSSDMTTAMKFGDTIFAFDAGKLQHRGAKKMKYVSEKQMQEHQKQTGTYVNEDDPKNPKIFDIYRYEREWFVWLPFTFKSDELVKVIFVKPEWRKPELIERAKNLLQEATKVPVQIIAYPNYAQHGLETSKEEEFKGGDIKFNLYQTFGIGHEFMSKAREILAQEKKRIKEKHPDYNDGDIKYTIEHSGWYYLMNGVYRELQQMNERRHSPSLYDGQQLDEYFRNIQYVYDRIDWNEYTTLPAAPLKPLLEKLLSKREPLKEAFTDSFLSDEKDLEKAIGNYASSWMRPYREKLKAWMEGHLDKFVSYVQGLREGASYDITTSAREFIRETDKLTQLPDTILTSFPGSAIDNKHFENLGEDRIRRMVSHNPNLQDYEFKYELERSSGSRRKALELVRDIYYGEHPESQFIGH